MDEKLIRLINNSSEEAIEKMVVDGLMNANRVQIPFGPLSNKADEMRAYLSEKNYKVETISEPILDGETLNYTTYLEVFRK